MNVFVTRNVKVPFMCFRLLLSSNIKILNFSKSLRTKLLEWMVLQFSLVKQKC